MRAATAALTQKSQNAGVTAPFTRGTAATLGCASSLRTCLYRRGNRVAHLAISRAGYLTRPILIHEPRQTVGRVSFRAARAEKQRKTVEESPAEARVAPHRLFDNGFCFQRCVGEGDFASRQPEVLVLRGHGLLEAALLSLLAARLGVEVEDLPPLNSFDTLARVALAGAVRSHMLPPVLHLNRMRNIIAHELDAVDAETLMGDFVATMPISLSTAKERHGMATTEVFGASLLVLMYALADLHTNDSAGREDNTEASSVEE